MLILTNVFRSVKPTIDTTHIPTDGHTSKGINNLQIKSYWNVVSIRYQQ